MTNQVHDGEACAQAQGVWPLYVGLFLVLLSFFIMLVGLSQPDDAKASGVAESVVPSFHARGDEMAHEEDFSKPSSAALAKLGRDLGGLHRLIDIEQARRGEELRARLPASELFLPNSPELRGESTRLIDRVVVAFAATPPGSRLEVAFSLGRPEGDTEEGSLPLAISRDGVFARTLIARGASPAAISVGIDQNQPERASLVFRYVPVGSASLNPAMSGDAMADGSVAGSLASRICSRCLSALWS